MNCHFCQNILPKNRIFMINKKKFCSEKCFKLSIDKKILAKTSGV